MAIIKNPLTLVKQESQPIIDEDTMFHAMVVDYDGTILKDQWLNDGETFELPIPPEHERVNFQEEWCSTQPVTITTVDNVKHYSIVINKNDFQASPFYVTKTNALEYEIKLTEVTGLTFTIESFNGNNMQKCFIDWGDGSPRETPVNNISHTYSNYGTYIIQFIPFFEYGWATAWPQRLSSVSKIALTKICGFPYLSQSTFIGTGNLSLDSSISLEEVWFGKTSYSHIYNLRSTNIKVAICYSTSTQLSEGSSPSSMYNCKYVIINHNYTTCSSNALGLWNVSSIRNLALPIGLTIMGDMNSTVIERIVFPPNLVTRNGGYFQSVKKVNIPTTLQSFGSSAFSSWYSLQNIKIPSTQTTIPNSCFESCYCLSKIEIPKGVTSVGTYAFSRCSRCLTFDFSKCEQIPTLANTNAFSSINSLAKIFVPASLYNDWIAATNWANYASYIVAI